MVIQLPECKRRDISLNKRKRVLIYGGSFSGKTTFADQFPDPIMLNTDGNTANITAQCIHIKDEVKLNGRISERVYAWNIFKEYLTLLEAKQNNFKTVVVDLVEGMYEYCRSYIFAKEGIEHESDQGFGKGYALVEKEFVDVMKRVCNLDYENIILISRETNNTNVTKKTGESISVIKPDLRDKISNTLTGMVDLVGRVVVDNDTNRKLSFKNDEYVFGGGRLNIKAKEIPLNYDAFTKLFTAAPVEAPAKEEVKTSRI